MPLPSLSPTRSARTTPRLPPLTPRPSPLLPSSPLRPSRRPWSSRASLSVRRFMSLTALLILTRTPFFRGALGHHHLHEHRLDRGAHRHPRRADRHRVGLSAPSPPSRRGWTGRRRCAISAPTARRPLADGAPHSIITFISLLARIGRAVGAPGWKHC